MSKKKTTQCPQFTVIAHREKYFWACTVHLSITTSKPHVYMRGVVFFYIIASLKQVVSGFLETSAASSILQKITLKTSYFRV